MAPRRAPATEQQRPPRPPAKAPEKQSKRVLALCYVAIPLAICAFLLGCGGMAVLMDEPERAHWYSRTQFADTWRWLTQKNPFYVTMCVNGGMVVTLMLSTRLWEHRKALQAEAAAAKQAKTK
ncbi:hypothetical protein COHA_004937 [Chlorella ohadii]|uniref:Uncharacterized protein n=1 Tax=Chlorella ohadii TaxID=2649997 RepID=A0AAD5DRW1_9CHLO|nr:hypothetical protein COHA_004937 [Chlorella ohadii]